MTGPRSRARASWSGPARPTGEPRRARPRGGAAPRARPAAGADRPLDPVAPGLRPLAGAAAARLARALRLRRDLGLNYAGALLACDLLERIDELERRLRRYETDGGDDGPEHADPEDAGGPPRRADEGPALRPHRGRRRAPAAGPARPAATAWSRACSSGPRSTPRRSARRSSASSRAGRACPARARRRARCYVSRRSTSCSTRAGGGRAAQGRVRLRRARAAGDARRRGPDAAGRLLREHGVTRERFLEVLTAGARHPARHQRDPRGRLRGAGEVRPRPRGRGPRRAGSTR